MKTTEPGANNLKALNWVRSHEEHDNDDTQIKWEPWTGHYIEVVMGDKSDGDITSMSRRAMQLFHTPVWAKEWGRQTPER